MRVSLWSLVLGVAFAAAPKFQPPVLPDPVDPGAAASPYERPEDASALDGQVGGLDLTSLSRSIVTFTLTADMSALAAIDAAGEEALLRQVAADPRWRLVQWGGALVAFRRVKAEDSWTTTLRGYHKSADGTWRAALRFSPYTQEMPWATSPLVGRAKASAPSIDAKAFRYPGKAGWQGTALSWEGPEVALEVFEAGASDELPHTAEMLGTVPSYVASVSARRADVAAKGFTVAGMPAKEPAFGEPSVAVISPGPGELEVRARVHLDNPGVTWVRVLDDKLAPWEDRAVAAGTRELIGWSSDAEVLFYLQGRFPVPAGAAFSGTIEVWHQPIASIREPSKPVGAPVRLGAFPVKVPAR